MKPEPVATRQSGLDTLRALAVVAVVLYHLWAFGELPYTWGVVVRDGWLGVDLFFVLSGFLIGQQVLRPFAQGKRLQVGEFYRRRAYRILPSYFAVLALYVFVPWWREAPRLAPLWKFATFTMNFGFSFDRRAFSHAWSLCVEEHFYLLLPLVVLWLMRRASVKKTAVVVGLLMVSGAVLRGVLIARYPDQVWPMVYYPSYARLDGLIVGVVLAGVRTFRATWWERMMQRGHSLLFVGVALVGCMVWLVKGEDLGAEAGPGRWAAIVGFPILAMGLGCLVASSVSRNGWLARVKVPGAKEMAALAFSLYLTHKEVAHAVMKAFPRVTEAQGPASWMLYAVTCLGAAVVLHVAVERPFLWLRDRGDQRRSAAALEAEMVREPAL